MVVLKRRTYWYLEPRDGLTNESITEYLSFSLGATADMFSSNKKDCQGKPHDVVEVPYSAIDKVEKNTRLFLLKFNVFTRRDGEECIRKWKFGGQSNLSRTRAVRDAAKKIAKLPKK